MFLARVPDAGAGAAGACPVGEVLAAVVQASNGLSSAEIISCLHGGVPLPTVPGPGEVQRRRVNATALMFIRQRRTVPLHPAARGRLGGEHQPPSPPWGKG